MPRDNTPAELVLTHQGISVYHIYKDDDYDSPVRDLWFSLSEYGSDGDSHGENGAFCIDDIPGSEDGIGDDDEHMQFAIAAGYFDEWHVDGQRTGDHAAGEACFEFGRTITCDSGGGHVIVDPTVRKSQERHVTS